MLNPINFMLISMLELALTKSPNNNSLKIWLMKILGKQGLASRFTQIGHSVKGLSDNSFESFGALKYSIFQSFCVEKELEQNVQKYEKFYSESLAKNKSALVSGFAQRDFQDLNEIMSQNEKLEASYLRDVFLMSNVHMNLFKFSTNPNAIGKVLAKQTPLLNRLCDESDRANDKKMTKITVETRQFKELNIGKSRD